MARHFFPLFVLLILLAPATVGASAGEEGFRPIFDGRSLEGWDGDPQFWRVEDGAITGETTAAKVARENTFLIWRGGKPADFELKLDFRLPDKGPANSGIQFRSWEEPGNWRVGGYQADIDSANEYTGVCYGEHYRGMLAQRGQKVVVGKDHKPKVVETFGDSHKLCAAIKQNDWNEYWIVAEGNRIIQKINGQLMCEVSDQDAKARRDGVIALQIHTGPPFKVQFRNIRLKTLPQQP